MTVSPLRGSRREAGFALAETLIAAAIIAGVTVLAFDVIAQDARVRIAMRERREAVLVAQSMLAGAAAGAVRTDHGETDGLRWRLARNSYDSGGSAEVPLDRIVVRVSDASTGRGLVSLETLALRR
jgi:hypothetical protein